MKKLVLLFIVFFVCFNFVNADTFYGQFRLVEEINNYRDDMLKIETYKLYNTYEKEYLDMGYMIENDKYLIDENDSKVEYVNVLENDVGDEYITVKVDNNKTIYINFSELDPKMKIYELELFYKGSKNYYEFYELPNDDLKKIRDGDLNTYLDCSILDNFKLNLFDAYVLSDIKMILHTNSNEDYIFKLSVPHIKYISSFL